MYFGYAPETPVIERLRFLSDVSVSKDGTEQRVNLRVAPRQEFDYLIVVEDADRQAIENLLFDAQDEVVQLPIWTDATELSNAAAISDGVIDCDTTISDFRVGENVALVSEGVVEMHNISAVANGSITLGASLTSAWEIGTQVIPVRNTVIVGDVAIARYAINLTQYKITFAATTNDVDLKDISPFTILGDSPVVDDPNAIENTLAESWTRQIVTNDGNTGVFSTLSFWDRSKRTSAKTFKTTNRTALMKARKLIHWLRGMQQAFWLPTFGKDLTLASDIASGDAHIIVVNAGYSTYTRGRSPRNVIRLLTTDGTQFIRTITSGNIISTDVENLNVSVSFGANISMDSVASISVFENVRLNTDEVTIEHADRLGTARIGIPVLAIPQSSTINYPSPPPPPPPPPAGPKRVRAAYLELSLDDATKGVVVWAFENTADSTDADIDTGSFDPYDDVSLVAGLRLNGASPSAVFDSSHNWVMCEYTLSSAAVGDSCVATASDCTIPFLDGGSLSDSSVNLSLENLVVWKVEVGSPTTKANWWLLYELTEYFANVVTNPVTTSVFKVNGNSPTAIDAANDDAIEPMTYASTVVVGQPYQLTTNSSAVIDNGWTTNAMTILASSGTVV